MAEITHTDADLRPAQDRPATALKLFSDTRHNKKAAEGLSEFIPEPDAE